MLLRRHFKKSVLLLWLAALTIGLRGAGQLFRVLDVTGAVRNQDVSFSSTQDLESDTFTLKSAYHDPHSFGKLPYTLIEPNILIEIYT